jgi:hypothetical protein
MDIAAVLLLGWPASESGTICRVHGDQERGDRRPPPEGLHVAYPPEPATIAAGRYPPVTFVYVTHRSDLRADSATGC